MQSHITQINSRRVRVRQSAFTAVLIMLGIILGLSAKAQSPLNSGRWVRVAVLETGIYELDAAFFEQVGWSVTDLDPAHIHVHGLPGGMLPQANSIVRPLGMPENAILVTGSEDGRFGSEDRVLFYAQGPDDLGFDQQAAGYYYANNAYADTAYYYVTVRAQAGLRLTADDTDYPDGRLLDHYDALQPYERDEAQILSPGSGRHWLGEKFDLQLRHEFRFDVSNAAPNATGQLVVHTVTQAFDSTYFEIMAGDAQLRSYVPSVPKGTYEDKGAGKTDTLSLSTSSLNANELLVEMDYFQHPIERGLSYLDYLFLQYDGRLQLGAVPLQFSTAVQQDEPVTYSLAGLGAGSQVWNVTDPTRVQQISLRQEGATHRFSRPAGLVEQFISFNPAMAQAPVAVQAVSNQDLVNMSAPDFLIITHGSLQAEAARLAAHRTAHDGLSTRIVTVQQIYHDYSAGRPDVTAIRDFVRHLYSKGGNLRYLLMFGKGTVDYRGLDQGQPNLVPTYESRNSTHPIFSYASDDYFGLLDADEGFWEESRAGDGDMEIGIGRIPVVTSAEAAHVVDKIIRYDTSPELFGSWKNRLFFVADDGDNNLHLRDAESLSNQVSQSNGEYNIDKLYLDAFPQEVVGNGQESPAARQALQSALERSGLIVNFTGHGDEVGWMFEDILVNADIAALTNGPQLPFFVTATCEFGRNDDPLRRSGAELLLTNPLGGGIGMVTTSRPVFSNTNLALNRAFYDAVFLQEAGASLRLGDIFRRTKNNSLTGPVNRNFSLLGDPSMRLAFPENRLVITEVNGLPVATRTDTLKALQEVQLTGEVQTSTGALLPDYTGQVEVTVFDLPYQFETLGQENPRARYNQRTNVLFRGQATVVEGRFEIAWVNPKNISYLPGQLKVSMYATDGQTDASGAFEGLPIGNGVEAAREDDEGPEIAAFLENRLFKNGQATGAAPLLLVDLADEHGINLSENGLGQGITAVLDDSAFFDLSAFYLAAPDDFTTGTVTFQLPEIIQGRHELKLIAWDTYNNASETVVDFVVSENNQIRIDRIDAIPNPFADQVTIRIVHNSNGEDITVRAAIYTIQGRLVLQEERVIPSAPVETDLFTWTPGTATDGVIEPGLYLLELIIESLSDGSKNRRIQKLVYRK